ncbi:MAG: transporter substrate-binding domain-containing protein [Desulfobacteraceae bacterium]|nr:transporter substrate-binding domain-containing protein [Desulfobacteraceae bacterium]MDH3567710.1 transporter substrate-binding domain-containing protein [Desulfobacteraceae bacterium]
MKKGLPKISVTIVMLSFWVCASAIGADIDLAKKSTLETILKRGELWVGFDSGYMPFEMTNQKGRYVGFDIDIAKEMAKAVGVKFVPVTTAWDDIIPSLTTGKFDIIISGMTVTQERNLKISFADPYIIVGQTILINKKHEKNIKSYKDLNYPEYIVTSQSSTTGEQAVKNLIPRCTYKSFKTENEAVLEVINGNADAFVYDLPFCVVVMVMQGKDKLFFLDKPFTYEPLAWAIRKGDPDFLNWLNNFLRQIKNDGRYDRIYNKWIKSTDWIKNVQRID